MKPDTCSSCKWMNPNNKKFGDGVCKRFPPYKGTAFGHPVMLGSDCCGEYEFEKKK